jgi:hypothetical protein
LPLEHRLLAWAGLAKPYRFERALVLAAALGLGVIAGAAALWLGLKGDLILETPRGWHFLYLAALILATLVAVPWPRLAAVLLSLAALEIGLGMGSALLYKFRLASSETLFPRNYTRPPYGWHPLLQAAPLPTPPQDAASARIFINSQGLRGPERSLAELRDKTVVATFGGSTTFDFISPQGLSWPEQLEALLGAERYAVINHGRVAYSTAESLIQTAFYQSTFGAAPRCALYYIGWNDLRSIHIRNLDPGYADFHLRSLIDTLEARRIGGPRLSISPTLSLLGRFATYAFDTARPARAPVGRISAEPDQAFEAIYTNNIRTISAINRGRGIRTLWTGQLMNPAALTDEQPDPWIPFVRQKDVWPLMMHLNALLRREAEALGDIYIDVPIADFTPQDFGDEGHFVPRGSLKFAGYLAPAVGQSCRGLARGG